MTQTIDFAHAEATELNRWLAEKSCQCGADTEPPPRGKNCWRAHGPGGDHRDCNPCKGTGLAYPWASNKCNNIWCQGSGAEPDPQDVDKNQTCHTCNGSGRVPKAVGLSELIVQSQHLGCYDAVAEAITKQLLAKWSTSDEITLAALRAVAGSQIQ